jgi:hypothetical protein
MRFRVAGLEVEVITNAPSVAEELRGRWEGYASAGGDPDIRVAYEAVPGFAIEQPAGREYPGFAASAGGPGEIYVARQDGRGVLRAPDNGPVEVEFTGLDQPFAIEAVLRLAVATALPLAGGLMLHSSGGMEQQALLFLGKSGAGKSTISRLLNLRRLGDDLTAVRPDPQGRFHAHATPFAGEIGPAPDGAAPLAGVHFLRQGAHHLRTPVAPRDALPELLRNTMAYVVEARTASRVLAAAAALVDAVPCYVLEFRKDADVAAVLGVT